MGQYFRAVNTDRQEYVCPWCIGGGAKLWEWAASPQGAIFTLLLRKSTGSGGGDYFGYRRAYGEGTLVRLGENDLVGRWAMQPVALVGDYDDSGLFEAEGKFRNISKELVETWNEFIEIEDMKLEYAPCSSCKEHI